MAEIGTFDDTSCVVAAGIPPWWGTTSPRTRPRPRDERTSRVDVRVFLHAVALLRRCDANLHSRPAQVWAASTPCAAAGAPHTALRWRWRLPARRPYWFRLHPRDRAAPNPSPRSLPMAGWS